MKIKSDKTDLMTVDQAIIIGLQNQNEVKLNIQGNLSLEEVLDMLNTALLELLNTFEQTQLHQKPLDKKQQKALKEEIYQRAVLGFSLIIDKYYPEGIKSRFNNLTEEAIMKAQDEILLRKQKQT